MALQSIQWLHLAFAPMQLSTLLSFGRCCIASVISCGPLPSLNRLYLTVAFEQLSLNRCNCAIVFLFAITFVQPSYYMSVARVQSSS
jgi:hypothetical protein